MGTLVRDEHSFLASEIFSLPYLQRPAAVRFGDLRQRFPFEKVIKRLRLPGRGSAVEKTPKGWQVLAFIGLSAFKLEWFGGCQLRHKPQHRMPGGGCLHVGELAEQNKHPRL